ncbi:MAG: thioredoxin family protein [Bacteroidota bacterium]
MQFIPKSVVESAYNYTAYRQLVDNLFDQNKTTGSDHSPAMLQYTKLNLSRMNRLDKKPRLTENRVHQVKNIGCPMIWLVITEGWCGDAAQIVPVLQHLVQLNPLIELRFILRDQHLAIMDAFLTNGGRSIPKVLVLDASTLQVLTTWGPRPEAAQELVMAYKAKGAATEDIELKKRLSEQSGKDLHLWYAKDKTVATQIEFLEVVARII